MNSSSSCWTRIASILARPERFAKRPPETRRNLRNVLGAEAELLRRLAQRPILEHVQLDRPAVRPAERVQEALDRVLRLHETRGGRAVVPRFRQDRYRLGRRVALTLAVVIGDPATHDAVQPAVEL